MTWLIPQDSAGNIRPGMVNKLLNRRVCAKANTAGWLEKPALLAVSLGNTL